MRACKQYLIKYLSFHVSTLCTDCEWDCDAGIKFQDRKNKRERRIIILKKKNNKIPCSQKLLRQQENRNPPKEIDSAMLMTLFLGDPLPTTAAHNPLPTASVRDGDKLQFPPLDNKGNGPERKRTRKPR